MTVSNAAVRSIQQSAPARFTTIVLRGTSSTSTPLILTSDTLPASILNQIVLSNDSTYSFTILVVARRTDVDGENAGWEFKGVATKNIDPTSTALLGASKSTLYKTTVGWECDIAEDTINGGLKVTVTGQDNKIIKWVANVNIVEVTG